MGKLVGVDYSAKSVALAKQIRDSKDEECGDIQFEEFDLLKQDAGEWSPEGGFDVVLDKGTFDAICLSEETDAEGRRICEGYRERVEKLVKSDGRFLVTSCNWTSDEIKGWFDRESGGQGKDGKFVFERAVKYPSFTFGGVEGQKVASLCFKRV
ncbi:hypothetical protein GQ43DRAFT_440250 [Delitschia confertaspora ATCC 74209]|uniref:Methyltransferase domain-containing protein n=1 Tax=Delitschia confertaspora ATCC 74209 TaxID=1513339 RepID=A0A9P4JMK1_9PLEO|nr:hypothetical protein GQ43DRAFT_440250 [Delitschia confertaspora ATCC 74209]